jgi:hypothetical protein
MGPWMTITAGRHKPTSDRHRRPRPTAPQAATAGRRRPHLRPTPSTASAPPASATRWWTSTVRWRRLRTRTPSTRRTTAATTCTPTRPQAETDHTSDRHRIRGVRRVRRGRWAAPAAARRRAHVRRAGDPRVAGRRRPTLDPLRQAETGRTSDRHRRPTPAAPSTATAGRDRPHLRRSPAPEAPMGPSPDPSFGLPVHDSYYGTNQTPVEVPPNQGQPVRMALSHGHPAATLGQPDRSPGRNQPPAVSRGPQKAWRWP